MGLIYKYRLSDDFELITQMQKASLEPRLGLTTEYGLVCSDTWWDNIHSMGLINTFTGLIEKKSYGPMGDWPIMEVVDKKGKKEKFTIPTELLDDISNKTACIKFVEMEAKDPPFPGYLDELVISIDIYEE